MLNEKGNALLCKHPSRARCKSRQNRNKPASLSCWKRLDGLLESRLLLFTFLCFCLSASKSSYGDDHITNSSYKISSNKNTEKIGIGNSKTNNYNINESNYSPTQVTQVVLNVAKPKKLRKSRAPVEAEFAIKRRILQVYELAKQEAARLETAPDIGHDNQVEHVGQGGGQALTHLNQLGRIIQALNPKYIATERVRRVAFADPDDPNALVPLPSQLEQPQPEVEGVQSDRQVLHLDFNETTKLVPDQLDQLTEHFNSLVSVSQDFIRQLELTPDETMSPVETAFKRLLLCLNDSRRDRCDMEPKQQQPEHHQQQTMLALRRQESVTKHEHDDAELASKLVSEALRDVSHIVGETDNHQIYVKTDAFPTPDFKRGLKETVARAKAARLNRPPVVHDRQGRAETSPEPRPPSHANANLVAKKSSKLNLNAIRSRGLAHLRLNKPSSLKNISQVN